MVQSGGCSASDFREVFKKNIERRVRSLPEMEGLSKETVLSSWMAKYDAIYGGQEEDEARRSQQQQQQPPLPPPHSHMGTASELILSKEQLYQMFQQILDVRKVQHQLLYNACQVGPMCGGGRSHNGASSSDWKEFFKWKHWTRSQWCDCGRCLCLCLSPQLDNVDEQAAQIRRELDGRLQLADRIARVSLAPPTDDDGLDG